MRGIAFSLAVLLTSFWLTAPAFGQCENGQCRRPVAKAMAAPVRVVAAVPRVVAPVVRATAKVVVAAPRVAVRVAVAPAKAMKHAACKVRERHPVRRALFRRRCCR